MSNRASASRSKRPSPVPTPSEVVRPKSSWQIGVVLAITLMTFAPVCRNGFLHWDDPINVAKNARLNPPTLARVALFWCEPYLELYIPVTYTAWSGLAAIAWMPEPDASGYSLRPIVFHLANLAVHLGSVAVVYCLLRRLIGRPWPAAAGALLFATHPLQVEAVAWITGMKDVLAGFFALTAIWQYASYADPRPPIASPIRRGVHYFIALFAFVLAILSKPSAIVVSLACIVIDRAIFGRPWKKAIEAAAPLLVVAVALAIYQVKVVQTVTAPADQGRFWLRPLIAGDSTAFYLWKLAWPARLGFNYDRTPQSIIDSRAIYVTWIAPAALLALVFAHRARFRLLLPAATLFIVGLVPVLGLVPFGYQQYSGVADRYVYVAMLGPALALTALLNRWAGASLSSRRWIGIALGLVFLVLGIRSFMQTRVFRDDRSFFTHGLEVDPKSTAALDGLALDDARRRNFPEALDYAERAVELERDSSGVYIVLADILDQQGDVAHANSLFQQLVDRTSGDPDALRGLGATLCEMGRFDQAEPHLRQAIHLNMEDAEAHQFLTTVLLRQNRLQEAETETIRAYAMDPGNSRAQAHLARYLEQHGQHAAALRHARIALKISPDLPEVQNIFRELNH